MDLIKDNRKWPLVGGGSSRQILRPMWP